MKPQRRPFRGRLRRGIFILPSLFTTGNILLGFYAIILAYRGRFSDAALLIFLAAIIDTLDGRIARMTGTDSEFGREYDSLADLLTFGVAPPLMAFFWGLEDFSRIGWLIPLFFTICTATRLARFNIQTSSIDSRFFVGMPAPAAASSFCAILYTVPQRSDFTAPWQAVLSAITMAALILLGSLMVSTFRYRSFKQIDLRKRWSYRALLPICTLVLVIALRPEAFFLAIGVLYTASAPIAWLMGRLKRTPSPGSEEGQLAEGAVIVKDPAESET
ncbi:MAG: CDP-diacylglycerol--serine O-phosphatidyltransferase [Deltaproteobacteria bacterium]|nr:CDP-diacylglycerol--serine O-phosphatidyltransferase [Deltaproteobacteria bacterium]